MCANKLLLAVLVLLCSVQARGELVRLQAEGRIDKVDAAGLTDLGIEVGTTFALQLSYDTEVEGTCLVDSLTIDSKQGLTEDETLSCRVNQSSKIGDWHRLRLTVERIKDFELGSPGSSTASLDIKLAFDSRTDHDLNPTINRPNYLSFDVLNIPLGSETFFHLICSDKNGLDDLISGEITSLIKVDG